MAQMLYSDLQTQVQDWLPGKQAAPIVRAANYALRKLYERAGPTVRLNLTTTALYETGTVAITQGQTALTMAGGTFAAGTDGQLIQCDGEMTWYGFTRVGANTGTLASGFGGATLTAGTYQLVYAYYDLPTTISATFNLWRDPQTRLTRMNDEEFTRFMGGPQSPGQPRQYALVKGTHTTNSAVRILLAPYPDAVYTYTGSGRARPTLFTGTGSEYTGLPEEYDEALLAGALFYLTDQRDKQDRSGWWFGYWEKTLKEAQATQNEGFDTQYGEASQGQGWDLWQTGPI